MPREIDSLAIRDILVNLARWGYEGGNVQVEPVRRNAFCIRIDDSAIFTVHVEYGGALSSRENYTDAQAQAEGYGSVAEMEEIRRQRLGI